MRPIASHWIVLLWTVVAVGLRLHQLDAKPLWTDEISTIAFSLGSGFVDVPLRQVLMAEVLLEPLRVDPTATPRDAALGILAYSNHPPLFFVVMHLWLQATHSAGQYVVPAVARGLSAVVGGLLTPLVYGLVRSACRAQTPAYLAAVLTAFSPFGVYLAQEARHYTLALVWMTASLWCLTVALQRLQQGKPLPRALMLGWIVANGLGLATHYFTALTLLAQVLVLAVMAYRWRQRYSGGLGGVIKQIALVALGTAVSGLVWLLALVAAPDQGSLTQWIQTDGTWLDWLNPLTHTAASAVSMAYLLPVQRVPEAIALVGVMVVLAIAAWSLWGWRVKSFDQPDGQSDGRLIAPERYAVAAAVLWGVSAASILIILAATYGNQIGLAQTLRYHFVYYPAFVGAMAVGLAYRWRSPQVYSRALVILALAVSAAGGLSVTQNLAYQKVHRPDRIVAEIVAKSDPQRPLLLATSHQSHGQTGRLMAIAWGLRMQHPELLQQAHFYLDPQPCARTGEQNCGVVGPDVREAIVAVEPGDVWLFNYEGRSRPAPRCRYQETERVDGYKVQHYHCM
ncbi:MAG: glycosyltransferase family 39 protein [Cyanobacteria bacterium P01_A01_bin.135]